MYDMRDLWTRVTEAVLVAAVPDSISVWVLLASVLLVRGLLASYYFGKAPEGDQAHPARQAGGS
jgi:hypothetical protein